VDPEPIKERDPAGHVTHVDSLVAPGMVEYFPEEHPMHAISDPAKMVVLYRPATHTVQLEDTADAQDPCVQFRHVLASLPENDPAGQDKHWLDPCMGAI